MGGVCRIRYAADAALARFLVPLVVAFPLEILTESAGIALSRKNIIAPEFSGRRIRAFKDAYLTVHGHRVFAWAIGDEFSSILPGSSQRLH